MARQPLEMMKMCWVFLYVFAYVETSHLANDGVDCSDTANSQACSASGTSGTALLQKKTMLSSIKAQKTNECKDGALPCLARAPIKPWKVPQSIELDVAGEDTRNSPLTAVDAGSNSTRLSTCFSKGVDVCFDDCFHDSAVCKQSFVDLHQGQSIKRISTLASGVGVFLARSSGEQQLAGLHLRYVPDSRTLCITGSGYETRAQSTVQMIKDAVHSLDKDCKSLSQFRHKIIAIGDMSDCSHDMAYSAQTWTTGCNTKLIPDFAFYEWPEAGLLPDYKRLAPLLASLGSHPATERRCGWAGNVTTNPIREEFARNFKNSTLFDIVTPESNIGPGGQGGRISIEDQVRRWACFVELPGHGYSGRVPYLLQSGRPILMVERGPGPMAPTWYSHLLEPWVHYIPVLHNMSDLAEKAKFALGMTPGSNATKIAAAAQQLAQTHLSYDAAINHLADSLLKVSQAS